MDVNEATQLRISLVTPNFNGRRFLAKTIESVLSQEYPNLEYIVVDAGSTDGSLEVIDQYRDRLSRVIVEPDRGHSHALNKGFEFSTGSVMGWINSDDLLLPGALTAVNRVFTEFPGVEWITGRASTLSEDGMLVSVRDVRPWSWLRFVMQDCRHIQQESTFWRRNLWLHSGGELDEDFGIAGDFELWTRFLTKTQLHSVDIALGAFRFSRGGQLSRPENQGLAPEYESQTLRAIAKLGQDLPLSWIPECLEVLKADPLVQPSVRFDEVDVSLKVVDPPIIRYDRPSDRFVSASANEVLYPAGSAESSPVLWCDLDFRQTSAVVLGDLVEDPEPQILVGIDISLGHDQAPVHRGPYTDHLPWMPALIGPVAIYALGEGAFRVVLNHADGRVDIPVQVHPESDCVNLRLVVNDLRCALFVDGLPVRVDLLESPLRTFRLAEVIFGQGFLQRKWFGVLKSCAIWTRSSDEAESAEASKACEVRHASGGLRQFRSGLRTAWSDTDLTPFRGCGLGSRMFVMGNGPSLNKMDLELLGDDVVFACNSAFLLFPRVKWRPRYYTCVDSRVLLDRAREINKMLEEHPSITAFFPSRITLHDGSHRTLDTREIIKPTPNCFYFHEVANQATDSPHTMFSADPNDYVVQPYSVAVTMLQLAAYMGFSPVYLIGIDARYSIPETVLAEGRKIDETGVLLTSTQDDDANHFDPRYFGAGRVWHHPQVDKMIMHFEWAQKALRPTEVQVHNATIGGRLEVFPRVDFRDLFWPKGIASHAG